MSLFACSQGIHILHNLLCRVGSFLGSLHVGATANHRPGDPYIHTRQLYNWIITR
jgi:hypothetical protein